MFSYGDAQRYRLGVNFNQIPVNAPKCPFHSYHRDGAMRTDGNLGPHARAIVPNSRGEWTDQPELERAAARDRRRRRALGSSRRRGPLSAAGRSVPEDERRRRQQVLFDNTARQVGQASRPIQERHVANCSKADPAYGKGVADALVRFAAGKL